MPEHWADAVDFGMLAARKLERTKISILEAHVDVTAISESLEEKQRIEADLRRRAPEGVTTQIEISAPRPVIAPFILRFTLDARRPRPL